MTAQNFFQQNPILWIVLIFIGVVFIWVVLAGNTNTFNWGWNRPSNPILGQVNTLLSQQNLTYADFVTETCSPALNSNAVGWEFANETGIPQTLAIGSGEPCQVNNYIPIATIPAYSTRNWVQTYTPSNGGGVYATLYSNCSLGLNVQNSVVQPLNTTIMPLAGQAIFGVIYLDFVGNTRIMMINKSTGVENDWITVPVS